MQSRNYLATILGCTLLLVSISSGAWTVNENFDGQTVGDRCAPFWVSAGFDSTVSTDESSSGSKSCKFAVAQGNSGWGGGFVMPGYLKKGDETWIRFRLFIPAGFDFNAYGAGDRLKFIRIAIRDPADVVGYLNWYWLREGSASPFAEYMSRDTCTTDCWQYFGDVSDGPVRGRWETYEMYVKFDYVAVVDGGQARVRTWKNGKLMGDLTDRPTLWPGSINAVSFKIFDYWNGTAPATQHLYFEDLVATDTTPSAIDSSGNPYIGVGNFVAISPPGPPTGVH